jgi:hypothetical protein
MWSSKRGIRGKVEGETKGRGEEEKGEVGEGGGGDERGEGGEGVECVLDRAEADYELGTERHTFAWK